jgi:hypothetical protein
VSYCRWSSGSDPSDVYCFGDGRCGWTTHVAMNRLSGAERKPIGLAHDGKSFQDKTLQDLKARLLSLRLLGYRVPDDAIDRIDQELADCLS